MTFSKPNFSSKFSWLLNQVFLQKTCLLEFLSCCNRYGLADILAMVMLSLFPDIMLTGAQLDLDLKQAFSSYRNGQLRIMDHCSR